MILVCQLREHARELGGVARPEVGRDAHAHQQHARSGRLRQAHHLREIVAGRACRQSAQAVIGPQLQNHQFRPVQLQRPRQALEAPARGLATHAGVDDLVPVPL